MRRKSATREVPFRELRSPAAYVGRFAYTDGPAAKRAQEIAVARSNQQHSRGEYENAASRAACRAIPVDIPVQQIDRQSFEQVLLQAGQKLSWDPL